MEKLIEQFSLGLFVWQLVLFIALVLLLKKFAWKPILNAVNEREEARRLMLEKKLMDEGGGGLESSLLFITVLDCLIKKEQLSIFINHEGEVWPVKLNKLPVLWGFEEFRKFMQGHYICISLTSVISSFIKEYVVKKENFQLQILTEKEKNSRIFGFLIGLKNQ